MSQADLLGASLLDVQPAAFARLTERLLWHLGFENVYNIDGPGDGGADLVGRRRGERWVFQVKSTQRAPVSADAVEELLRGTQIFNADRGALVTNREFTRGAKDRIHTLNDVTQSPNRLQLWNRNTLLQLAGKPDFPERFGHPELRPYQVDAFQALWADLKHSESALMVLATGLGKTVVAGAVIERFLSEHPGSKILVLAHRIALVDQLEKALWKHIPKHVPTQQLSGQEHPHDLEGITAATIQSAITYVREGFRPDFIFIDEAHHVGEGSEYAEMLELCPDALRLGATATPLRGDAFDITEIFGEPLDGAQVTIEEGMKLGYLADVDYRLLADNVDWLFVQQASENNYSLGELNRKLFLPQQLEGVRDELLGVWQNTISPKGIVFCQSVQHAERMLEALQGVPDWTNAATIHNELHDREKKTRLAKFRLGDIPLLIAVDILNEGVDVPDVNIICFSRVTHSRRIFVQQLGRGLRLNERTGKTKVTVLDFVSDLRRAKAALDLRSQVCGETEDVYLPSSHSITFSDQGVESLIKEWLYDEVADFENASDDVLLKLPPFSR